MSNLKAVKLSKAWGSNPKGAVVLVDSQRADYLTDNGFGKEVRDGFNDFGTGTTATLHGLEKAPAKPPVDKMVKTPPKRKGKR